MTAPPRRRLARILRWPVRAGKRPEDADGVIEVFDEFFPDVRPPRCVSKLGVDRPGILVSIAMVAVTD
ncbi:hypothetical protein [Nonomuraea sp. NEAU-A123]|uniref:hypothetical protein n=1 Tax=Nonomuraea sp. NEAU-A123 TaxID=2839649 RepID=UPI001BE47B9C|nr:hypothetical protein [Nonomuraea sp. NEAU-A123]MBT2232351.1 hypothetical protein [Nonomuraea sp. NEAU-A123]